MIKNIPPAHPSHLYFYTMLWATALKKKCIRTITNSKYNDHTDPLFSKLKLLKRADIFNLQQLEFYYKYIKGDLPEYFKSLNFVPNSNYHNYGTRHRNQLHIGITKKSIHQKLH